MNWKKTAVIAGGIIALGVAIAVIIYATRPKAERKKPPRMTPVVLTQAIKSEHRNVKVEVMGTVLPSLEAELKTRVTGEIIFAAPEWIEGGILKKGQTVLRLEDADYRIALDQAQSELALEMGRQDVAKREWEMLNITDPSAQDRELALRQPQLKSAKAKEEQARLNLERTEIKAPFNAIVTARNMNVGDQASPQSILGKIVSTDSYYVRVSVPVEKLKWIDLPSGEEKGSEATVHLAGEAREGQIIKLLADLEENGRMARCLVEIKNPLSGERPLLLNSFVRVVISGRLINDVYEIHRSSLHEGGTVWLLTKESRLKTIHIEPLWGDRDHVFFQSTDIADDDRIITSPLSIAVEGMELREAGDEKAESAKENQEAAE